MPFTIRPATKDDVAAIAALHRHTRLTCFDFMPNPHDHTPEEDRWFFETQVFPRSELTVACDGSDIIGYAATTPGWLEHLYVHPEAQGLGIGKLLLAQTLSTQTEMRLWVFQKNPARAFYEKQGFQLEALHDGSNNFEQEPDAVYVWRR